MEKSQEKPSQGATTSPASPLGSPVGISHIATPPGTLLQPPCAGGGSHPSCGAVLAHVSPPPCPPLAPEVKSKLCPSPPLLCRGWLFPLLLFFQELQEDNEDNLTFLATIITSLGKPASLKTPKKGGKVLKPLFLKRAGAGVHLSPRRGHSQQPGRGRAAPEPPPAFCQLPLK